MDLAKSVTRGRMIEYASYESRIRGPSDKIAVALTAAASASVGLDSSANDIVREMQRLLPEDATPLERGMMMGAAMVLAMVPGK